MLRNTSSHNEMFSSLSPFQKHVTVGHYKPQRAFHLYVPASWRTQGRSAAFIATVRHQGIGVPDMLIQQVHYFYQTHKIYQREDNCSKEDGTGNCSCPTELIKIRLVILWPYLLHSTHSTPCGKIL